MSDLHPEHLAILKFAMAALNARDNHANWRDNPERAIRTHEIACNEMSDEIERQVQVYNGSIPVLPHPTWIAKQRVKQMRTQILNHVIEAIEELQNKPYLLDDRYDAVDE